MLIKSTFFLVLFAILLEFSQANLMQDLVGNFFEIIINRPGKNSSKYRVISLWKIVREAASEFLNEQREAIDAEKRMLFGMYTAKEQRREVVENYEEKCERKALSKLKSWDANKPRWCPPLTEYAFNLKFKHNLLEFLKN